MPNFQQPCPGCKDASPMHDSAENFTKEMTPKAGDWAVCSYCGTISRVTEEGTLRHATATEFVCLVEKSPIMAIQMHHTCSAIQESNTPPPGPLN